MRGLVGDQLVLRRQRQPAQIVPAAQVVGGRHTGGAPLRRPERVGVERGPDQRPRPAELVAAQPRGIQRLQRTVVHALSLAA
jgi:hypothetical protein